jgi:U2-associated protein SR140
MPESSKIREFPDISNKLTAPAKKSLFERQKAEAEAKRQRDEAETAAVYADFVRSFDDDNDDNGDTSRGGAFHGGGSGRHGGPPPRLGVGGAAGRRHFAPSSTAAGGAKPAPPRRRAPLDAAHALFAFEDAPPPPPANDVKAAFQASDDEDDTGRRDKYYDDDDDGGAAREGRPTAAEERAASKPTLHLASLPPGTTAASVRGLMPGGLTVDGVRMLAGGAAGPQAGPRPLAAIVTLAKDSPASEIDAAVSALQGRYLGCGFRLSISRHLSSALLGSGVAIGLSSSTATSTQHPFGARPVFNAPSHSLNRAPPPSSRGGYAPPASYGRGGDALSRGVAGNGPLRVAVRPPTDVRQLKLIHKTVEAVLTHGPEFEALLMSRPEVQLDEKWAWLWDSRSAGGVWYRWRLWEVLTGGKRGTASGPGGDNVLAMFSGSAPWQAPERNLKFEFTTEFESLVSDADYDSSDEEDSGDDEARQGAPGVGNDGERADGAAYLNPLQKAKLTHLLARLPTSTARLRRGDVARVTAFAIGHAGRGSDEVVRMLIDNVERPFALSAANPDRPRGADDSNSDDEREREDPSSAKLIGLFLISDLLSSSSTSGVRHAWRYRQLFEAALRARALFPRLGGLERELGWGKMRADKWRRAIGQLLALWEGWCVFASGAHEELVRGFAESADLSGKERISNEKAAEEEEARQAQSEAKRSAWRAVADGGGASETSGRAPDQAPGGEDVDGVPMDEDGSDEDLDGQPMDEDDDDNVDGEPMQESDGDGEPMDEDVDDQPGRDEQQQAPQQQPASEDDAGSRAAEARRRRPRAVDMFADSDGE